MGAKRKGTKTTTTKNNSKSSRKITKVEQKEQQQQKQKKSKGDVELCELCERPAMWALGWFSKADMTNLSWFYLFCDDCKKQWDKQNAGRLPASKDAIAAAIGRTSKLSATTAFKNYIGPYV